MNHIETIIKKIKKSTFHLSLKGYKREEVDLLLQEILVHLENAKNSNDALSHKIQEYSKRLEMAILEKEQMEFELTRLKSEKGKYEQR
ncbi:DivIVA domain-containing protein [Mycoplasmopsis columboralis]|uniref:DivIVA protein n=1 Tax=Mycoplasmopsis columboralis TaxID=171282 RepID=A0A449B6V2_9BACT|nr:DivIVA domain-containing protein [Mycoplasmopsis columboralis]VEU76333.1 DivIVA protein [Mycoplasmopsis columboralis]